MSAEQIQNMIFVIAVVIACAVIGVYLGTTERATRADAQAAGTSEPESTPEPGVLKDELLFSFVSDGYPIAETTAQGADFLIKEIPALGTVYLNAARQDKRIVALSLRIAIPAANSSADAYREALRQLFSACANALSGNAAQKSTDFDVWADEALSVMRSGGAAQVTGRPLTFSCLRQHGGETPGIVCTLTTVD